MTQRKPLVACVRNALMLSMAGSLAFAGSASAQDTPQQAETKTLDAVQVTGSRIRRVDAETASPVLVLDRAAIERNGALTVGALIQSTPAIAGAATNPQVNNGGGDGAATVSLRGLGDERTLLLLDGRRVTYNDLNSIPVAMIERIEILKDGASAIYGSDAIGGVVNFIIKRGFEGASATLNYGISGEDDGQRQGGSSTLGWSSDRGSAILSVNYNKQDPVLAADRDFSAFALYLSTGAVVPSGSSSTPRGRYTLPAAVANANGLGACVGGNGLAQVTRREGASGTTPADFRCYVGGTTDSYNYQAAGNVLMTPQERAGVSFSGEMVVTDTITAFATMYTQNTRSAGIIAPLPFFSDFDGIALDANSIYNPFGATINGRYRVLGLGNRSYEYETDVKQFYTGLEGSIGDSSWRWDAAFSYGKLAQRNEDVGYIDYGKLANALGPSFRDAGGVARCGTPGAIIANCTPINFFNQPDPSTAAGRAQIDALSALRVPARDSTDNTERSFAANFSGDLFELPAGVVGAAAGFEYRKENFAFNPDAIKFIAGNGSTFGCGISSESCANPTSGETTVKEVYAEFLIPLMSNLNVTLGSRWSDYNSFGSTTNSKLGVEWRPIDDVLVRATYAEVFRAPTISDLYGGIRITNPVYSDPCNGRPLACAGLTGTGTFQQGLGQTNALLGGNESLRPETGSVFTWGAVYSPEWLDGFSATLDIWKVSLDDTIQTFGTQPILDACAAGATAFCQLFTRDASTGDVFLVQDRLQNAGTTETRGFDLGFKYAMDTDWGNFRWSLDTTYVAQYDVKIIVNGSVVDEQFNAGTFLPSSKGGLGNYSRWRALGSLGWNLGAWDAQWTQRYVHGFRVGSPRADGDCADNAGRGAVGSAGCVFNRGANTYHNFQVGYAMDAWNTKFQLGVDNAFNKQPAILYQNNSLNGNVDERTHDTIGRYYWASATVTF
jgi:iron complex outermembrane receptor protein